MLNRRIIHNWTFSTKFDYLILFIVIKKNKVLEYDINVYYDSAYTNEGYFNYYNQAIQGLKYLYKRFSTICLTSLLLLDKIRVQHIVTDHGHLVSMAGSNDVL